MSGELRAQRREPCVESGWAADKRCNPRLFNGDQRCDGCNGDGTRWVTVGTLRQPERGGKKAVLFQKLNDWWPEKVPVESKRGAPLYVIEDPGEATT